MTGRPSRHTPEIADRICERLSAGESLNAICRDERMTSRKSVHEWVADDRDGFRDKYARAREAQAEYWASEIIEIADSVRKGATSEEVQAARLAVDSRKWVASKLLPKRYGDKLETENRNIHEVSDPVAALLERVATSGRKIHDPRPRVIGELLRDCPGLVDSLEALPEAAASRRRGPVPLK